MQQLTPHDSHTPASSDSAASAHATSPDFSTSPAHTLPSSDGSVEIGGGSGKHGGSIRRILTVITIVLFILCLVLVVGLASGLRPYIVRTQSMEPLYHEDDLVIASTATALAELLPSDIIIYLSGQSLLLTQYQGEGMIKAFDEDSPPPLLLTTLVGKVILRIPGADAMIQFCVDNMLAMWVVVKYETRSLQKGILSPCPNLIFKN